MAGMKMSPRSQKFAHVVESRIPRIIQSLLSPESIGILTVTAIEVSGDLGVCDVFVRSIGGPKYFLRPLKKIEKKVAHLLSQEVEMRRVMKIRFKLDNSVDRLAFLDSLTP